jgi:hypothetical protein
LQEFPALRRERILKAAPYFRIFIGYLRAT